MDVDLLALRAFITLAEELNFARAAQRLNISASRLTRLIQSLEAAVGAQLLLRTTHRTLLTNEGEALLHSARRVVAEMDWVGHRVARHRVAAPATFTVGCLSGSLYDRLPDRIRAARLAHPHLQIRLVEMDEETLTQRVLDGSLDMGFLYFPSADAMLATRVVSRQPQWVAMAPDHPLAQRTQLEIAELNPYPLILPDDNEAPRLHRWYRSFLDRAGREAFLYVGANQIHVALGLCAAGEGLCVLAEHLRRVRADDLHFMPLPAAPHTELAAIWRHDSPVRQVAAFIADW